MTFRAKKFVEKVRRERIAQREMRVLWLKGIMYNQALGFKLRDAACKQLVKSNYFSSSAVRVKNRCLYTNRSKSVLRFFGMSRIVFRLFARSGRLVGVRRASW